MQLPRDRSDVTLMPAAGRSQLLVFLHPFCPCSSATVSELARLAPSVRHRADICVCFASVRSEDVISSSTQLRDRVAEIPGVRFIDDHDNQLAEALGVTTSGHTVLYDADGVLRFSGGLTSGRGHEGASPSQAALLRRLSDRDAQSAAEFCTFGCPLRSELSVRERRAEAAPVLHDTVNP